jgi:hypothetical protein
VNLDDCDVASTDAALDLGKDETKEQRSKTMTKTMIEFECAIGAIVRRLQGCHSSYRQHALGLPLSRKERRNRRNKQRRRRKKGKGEEEKKEENACGDETSSRAVAWCSGGVGCNVGSPGDSLLGEVADALVTFPEMGFHRGGFPVEAKGDVWNGTAGSAQSNGCGVWIGV